MPNEGQHNFETRCCAAFTAIFLQELRMLWRGLCMCRLFPLHPLHHITGAPVARAAADVDVGLGEVHALGQAVGDVFAGEAQ